MEMVSLRLSGLKLLKPRVFQDDRGYFFESFRSCEELPFFVQDNTSSSQKNVIRALHFQNDPGQAKLVQCLHGKIFDVAVDIRLNSPTFGQWEAVLLDDVSHHQLFIPVGFAHGFCVLSDTALVHYKVSSSYDPKTERSIRWNDPNLKVEWPVRDPILSKRDQTSQLFGDWCALDHR